MMVVMVMLVVVAKKRLSSRHRWATRLSSGLSRIFEEEEEEREVLKIAILERAADRQVGHHRFLKK